MPGPDMSGMASRLIDQDWPAADLEPVHQCPACGSSVKSLAFSGVKDWAFQAAPGSWDFWRCGHCQSLYLNPRPTASSMGRAYQRYYTHGAHGAHDAHDAHGKPDSTTAAALASTAALPPAGGANWIHRLRQECFFHWLGMESQTRLHLPANALTRVALALLKPFVARQAPLDQLAKLPRGRLLDVGCGNGELMAAARAMGFEVVGIEIDGLAVAAARARKLDVRQGSFEKFNAVHDFADSGGQTSGFDYVLCSHVLEHVHQPLQLIDWLIEAAKPGGRIFGVWPNPKSSMARVFGRHWRGLEAPRHVCLMSPEALLAVLARKNICPVDLPGQGLQTVGESLRLRREGKTRSGWADAWLDKLARFVSFFFKRWMRPDFLAISFVTPAHQVKLPAEKRDGRARLEK